MASSSKSEGVVDHVHYPASRVSRLHSNRFFRATGCLHSSGNQRQTIALINSHLQRPAPKNAMLSLTYVNGKFIPVGCVYYTEQTCAPCKKRQPSLLKGNALSLRTVLAKLMEYDRRQFADSKSGRCTRQWLLVRHIRA